MKILLDENLPTKLKPQFSDEYEVLTVREMFWNGRKNGELLGLMTLEGFDAFVTIDKNLQYQQNLSRFPIKLFILNAPNNKIKTLTPYIENLQLLLSETIEIQINIIEIG
jgi:predicted nuclease of predicted toxin-antitoxin system